MSMPHTGWTCPPTLPPTNLNLKPVRPTMKVEEVPKPSPTKTVSFKDDKVETKPARLRRSNQDKRKPDLCGEWDSTNLAMSSEEHAVDDLTVNHITQQCSVHFVPDEEQQHYNRCIAQAGAPA